VNGRLRRLLGGTAWVAAGVAVLGLAGYVYLAALHHRLPPGEVTALTNLYLLVNIIGPGLFVTLEQETGRLVSTRLAHGEGTRDTIRRMGLIGVAALGAVLVVLAGLGPVLVGRVLGDQVSLYLLLLLSVVAYTGVYLSRGVFVGHRRFPLYGVNVGTEGLVRLVGVLVLVAAGSTTASGYGLVLCIAPVFALLVTAGWVRPGRPGPVEPVPAVLAKVGWLGSAWLLSQLLANTAPLVVTGLLPGDPTTTAAFGQTFVLARVPLFLFSTLQAVLLPTFSRMVARSDHQRLGRAVRSALTLVAGLGGACVVGAVLLGGPVVRLAFGYRVSSWLVAALTLATVLLMVVQVLQPASLALAAHRWVSLAWTGGLVVFALCFLIPVSPVTAAVIAQFAAGVCVATVLGAVLLRRLRHDGAGAAALNETVVDHV
jgi:O-antigen/teichoic acid export membrane protein